MKELSTLKHVVAVVAVACGAVRFISCVCVSQYVCEALISI